MKPFRRWRVACRFITFVNMKCICHKFFYGYFLSLVAVDLENEHKFKSWLQGISFLSLARFNKFLWFRTENCFQFEEILVVSLMSATLVTLQKQETLAKCNLEIALGCRDVHWQFCDGLNVNRNFKNIMYRLAWMCQWTMTANYFINYLGHGGHRRSPIIGLKISSVSVSYKLRP